MDVFIDPKQRVENYFIAWKTYNTNLLKAIFLPNAKYIIRGKITYCGIDNIIKYWENNKKRQKDIKIHWKIIRSSFKYEIVEFGAYFWDREEQMYTKVNGQIIFEYDSDNRIVKLTEAYKKRVKNNFTNQKKSTM